MSKKYHSLAVSKITKLTKDAVSVCFELPVELKDEFKYRQGQYLAIQVNAGGENLRREYSLCSSPYLDEPMTIASKRIDSGKVSSYLYESLKEGDTIECMPPQGNFYTELNPDNENFYVLIGGGSGITPLFSILKSVLAVEPKSKIVLYYGNRAEDDIIFHSELKKLVEENRDRFKIIFTLSECDDSWQDYRGMVNTEDLLKIIDENVYTGTGDADYFICGPSEMMTKVHGFLDETGIPGHKIHTEYFTAPVPPQEDTMDEHGEAPAEESDEVITRDVKVNLDGEVFTVTVSPEQKIIDAVIDAGYDPPYSCLSGICTTCRAKLHSGRVSMDEREGLSDAEIEDGFILTCQSHPLSDDVDIEYE